LGVVDDKLPTSTAQNLAVAAQTHLVNTTQLLLYVQLTKAELEVDKSKTTTYCCSNRWCPMAEHSPRHSMPLHEQQIVVVNSKTWVRQPKVATAGPQPQVPDATKLYNGM
jgi:hypothetical protein